MNKRLLSILLACAAIPMINTPAVCAAENTGSKAERTILLYDCGADLETESGMASYNLRQILKANFSEGDNVKFVVLTGGSGKWHLESEYLCDPDNKGLSTDEETGDVTISMRYNQLWEAKGADAAQNPGKLVLLDADGITGAEGEAVISRKELMTDPDVLRAFIDYGVANYPAEKYDLILWDHGGGTTGGFGSDEHAGFINDMPMSVENIIDVLSSCKAVDTDGDGSPDSRFDFIDFDACLMSGAEIALGLADYTDYLIVSPELEPGKGQYYTGWLDKLGEDPEYDTYELGKIIVDDFFDFYDHGDGTGQAATLAVMDLQKLVAPETGFVSALREMAGLLSEEAATDPSTGDIRYYDELNSTWGAIRYGGGGAFFDLGNLASLFGVANVELTEDDIQDGQIDTANAFTDISKKLSEIFGNDEIIYAKGTENVNSADQVYRTSDGGTEHGTLSTSGMNIYYPVKTFLDDDILGYNRTINRVLDKMPDGDRKDFLNEYLSAMARHSMIRNAADAVNDLLNEEDADPGEISYEKVKDFWLEGAEDPDLARFSKWKMDIEPLLNIIGGETEENKAWLDAIVKKQAEECVRLSKISVAKIAQENGDTHRITVNDALKSVVKSVERRVYAELPSMENYIQKFDEETQEDIRHHADLSLGSVSGWPQEDSSVLPDDGDEQKYLENLIRWCHEKESVWNVEALEPKWFAVNDEDGKLHAVQIYIDGTGFYIVPARYGSEEDPHLIYLGFEKGNDNKLSEVLFPMPDGGRRDVKTEDLKEELEILPVIYVKGDDEDDFFVPLSNSSFKLNSDNWESITLDFTELSNISDIRDTDGDGEALHSTVTITDIYRNKIDITEKIQDPDEELISIDLVRVRPQVETGKELEPIITYKGKVLKEGTDYTQQILPFSDKYIEAGEHTVHLEGKGKYAGVVNKEFIILRSEEELAETYLDEAQDWIDKAENFFNPGNSYKTRQLFNAQNALADALNALIASKDKLPDARKQEIEKKAAELEKRIKALNDKLFESAKEIDFTNYFAVLERVFDYTGKEIKPEVTVPGLNKADYTVTFEDNIEPGKAKALITGKGKYKGTISESFKILEKKDEPEKEGEPEKEEMPEKEDKPEKEDEPGYKEGWVKTEKGWKYRKADGSFAKGWLRLGDRWFYLDSEGIMQTGWQEIDGERYYFDEEGVMQTGWQMIDGIWYYFIESGPLRK